MPEMEDLQPQDLVLLDDELWETLLALTDGAAAPCFQCGVCTAICPWGLVRGETVSVRTMLRQAQLGLVRPNDNLWLCTTCSHCEAYCPRGVNITNVLLALRYIAWENRDTPAGLPSLLWSVYWNNNPWTQPPSQRSAWAQKLNLPGFDPEVHEVLYYVGCTASYDGRAGKIAHALVQLLTAAGVTFGYLGDDEPCCGETVLSLGHKPYFEDVATQAAAVFAKHGVHRLLTTSPHCYDVFKNHYHHLGAEFVPQHYSTYLADLIDAGQLAFNIQVDKKVTFHDPCYLSRHNRETEAPRRILEAIPGLELLEMENTKDDTLCCGGGGGRMWMETAPGERFADIRTTEAMATGAEVLVTACPFCVACLEDSIKAQKIEKLVVRDVAEVAAWGINGQGPS